MNKKEISEIRKQLSIKSCCIERICGCYVDAEKDVRSRWRQCFLALPEDEVAKYLDIFGKALHGGLGKDLVNMGIRTAADSGAGILREMRATQIGEDDKEERAAYMGIIETVLGKHTTMDEVRRGEENLQGLKERHAGDLDQYSLSKDDLEGLLLDSGIGEERVRNLEGAYAAEAGKEERLTLDNLGNLRVFTVEMEGGRLELEPSQAQLAEVRELEGRKVLVVPLRGNVEVNGIRIDIGEPEGQA